MPIPIAPTLFAPSPLAYIPGIESTYAVTNGGVAGPVGEINRRILQTISGKSLSEQAQLFKELISSELVWSLLYNNRFWTMTRNEYLAKCRLALPPVYPGIACSVQPSTFRPVPSEAYVHQAEATSQLNALV